MTKKEMYDYKSACEELLSVNELESSGFELVYNVWKRNEKPSLDEESEFCSKFIKGYRNRPSVRKSNPTKTVPDRTIDYVLQGRIKNITDKMLDDIRFAHKISMGAENIIGSILEEYIHESLRQFGWSVCWGSCFKAVDLCSENGDLIQIKNKSNTENSSSNKIRSGTEIKKWYRMNANNGKYCWDELLNLTKCPESQLSEERFEGFTRFLISKNPAALFVDESELRAFLGEQKSLF